MIRFASFVSTAVLAIGLSAGCDKPTEQDCKKAVENMRRLQGTDSLRDDAEYVNSWVRRCKGGSSKKAVECATKATTLDELLKCDFYKNEPKLAPAGGSAVPPVGSAGGAMGSAGSAGAAMGSAGSAGAAMGSAGAAMGSAGAPAGSGATGSAAGSAAGAGSAGAGSAAAGSAGAGSAAAGSAATGSAAAGSAAAGSAATGSAK